MSRPRTADRPGWLRVRVRCARCGGGWWDWLPDGASLRVLRCAAEDIDCPACSGREQAQAEADAADAALELEFADEQPDAEDRPGRVAGALA